MASKLSLYNDALIALGERKLASLNENRAPKRRLDTVWDGGWVRYVLSQGLWNHAMNTVEVTFNPSLTPAFGYRYAFDKPADWCRTALVSDDETFCNKRVDFVDEGGYWYAHSDSIYVKYVSSDALFGGDLSLWPEAFTDYAAHYGALKICKVTTGSSTERDTLDALVKKKLNIARSQDAMNETPKQVPAGSWSRARRGGTRGDGGSSSNLIG
jgi:hypothetical protein